VGVARQAFLGGVDRDHRVEAKQRQVGHIIAVEAAWHEVGVEAAQASQSPAPGAEAPPVWHFDLALVADHHMGHVAAAVHQHTELPADLSRELRQLTGELVGQQPIGGEAAPIESLDRL
jgi:hypothetical protein